MAFAPHHDVFRALNAARIATRRGDVAQADRWMKIADRHLVMAQRLEKLRDYEIARDFEEERRHYILGNLVVVRESWAARNPKPEIASSS